jgi:hypothetical protein
MASSDPLYSRIFARLAQTDSSHYRSGFYALILCYLALILRESLTYSSDAGLFPLVVGVPLSLLLIGKLLAEIFGSQGDIEGPLAGVFAEVAKQEPDVGLDTAARYRREVELLGWVMALPTTVWLVGFLPAAVVYVPAFVYRFEKDTLRAITAGLVTELSLYLLFVQVLSAPVYDGVLGRVI